MSPSPRLRLLSACLLTALALTTLPGTATAAPAAVPLPSADPFYQPPNPLPAGKPGDLLRSRQVKVTVLGLEVPVSAWQILYRSTSATGAPMAVSGTILVPRTPSTGKPRQLVSYAVGAHGLHETCAPSYKMRTGTENEVALIGQFLFAGFAVVITDYQGLGTPGPHTMAVGPAAGHAMLDAARAAQKTPGPELGVGPVGIYGYSQGGQAASHAGELQPSYAPELQVAGVVAGGIPRDLRQLFPIIDGGPFSALMIGAVSGHMGAYPDLPEQFINEAGKKLIAKQRTECIIGTMLLTGAFKWLKDLTTVPDPIKDPRWDARLAADVPGSHKPTAPVLLFHGDFDEVIPFKIAKPLLADYCARGATVEWRTTHLTEHILGNIAGVPMAVDWLKSRFAGVPAATSC
ncbi:lipase family protein [Crossiella sp. CA198]|uniref:lipase family protein n=1 Tax=Crossiella sp. CA198 TaxID=3455607 RepID=UPI003F8CFD3C